MDDTFPDGCTEQRDFLAALADRTQTPPEMAVLYGMAIFGSALAQKVELCIEDEWAETPNLYTMALMTSGERKSSVGKALTAPLLEWEQETQERHAPDIARQRAERNILEKQLKAAESKAASQTGDAGDRQHAGTLAAELAELKVRAATKVLTTEPTPEALAVLLEEQQERILLASAEAGAFDVLMGRYTQGRPNLDIYLAGYSGDATRIDRKGRPSVHLARPLLSIALAVQPVAVEEVLQSKQARGRGLLARFMVAAPESKVGRRRIRPDTIPPELRDAYYSAVRSLLDRPIPDNGPRGLTLGREADGLFLEFREELEPRLRTDGDLGGIKDWANRLPAFIARIAMILHCVEEAAVGEESDPIRATTMRAALEWAPYLVESYRFVVRSVDDPDTERARRILSWIQGRRLAEFSRREAYRAIRPLERIDLVDEPLALLEELGHVRCQPAPQSGATGVGRRPSVRFVVNPAVHRHHG